MVSSKQILKSRRSSNFTVNMSEEEVNSKNQAESDSENDSPEDVSFSTSKQKALDALKTAEAVVKKEKQRVKEIRRKQHQLFKEQKENSKRKLLDTSVLDDLPSTGDLESKSPKEEEEEQKEVNEPPSNKIIRLESPEDVPVLETESTDFHVSSSRDQNKIRTHASKTALDFKRSKFFSSHIRRESTQERRRGDQKYLARNLKA